MISGMLIAAFANGNAGASYLRGISSHTRRYNHRERPDDGMRARHGALVERST